jgi:hypothetical protein
MGTRTWLIHVHVAVEQPEELTQNFGPDLQTQNSIEEVVTAALARHFSGSLETRVWWESMGMTQLDGKPGVGKCAICDCWVYDVENRTEHTPTEINRGAVVDGRLLCDEHLPEDHPIAF